MASKFTYPGRKSIISMLFALASFTFSFAQTTDVIRPSVISVSPDNWSITLNAGINVSAVFSEAMNASTINSSTFQLRNAFNDALVTATVTYNAATRTATLYPSSSLNNSLLYTGTIKGGSAGVKDLAGNSMAADYTWYFIMIPLVDLTPPVVLSVSPANGATAVATTTAVTAVLSEEMMPSSINASTVELRNASNVLVPATVTYNTSNRVITLTPSAPLAVSSVYRATIKGGNAGVRDEAGVPLESNYLWSFTTVAAGDITRPTVSSVSPVNATTGVNVTTAVSAIFSEAMNASTVNSSTFQLRNAANTLIAATVTYNAATRTVTLIPSAALTGSTVYTATITGGVSGVKDVAGNALVSNYVWSFTTADITPPTIISVLPVNAAAGVGVSTVVSAIFSEAMNASTVSGTTFQLRNAANTLITATVTYNAATRTSILTPSAALASSTAYTATITGGASGVKDAAGNALVSNYAWSFTTADIIPPTIISVSPVNGAAGVSVSTAVSAIFSEAMNVSTVSGSTFQLRNAANTLITATVAYNATTRTAILTPSAALASSTVYTATITGGASGVKDAAGNALVSNYVWSFTTADIIPPTVSSVLPVNGATGVSVSTAVSAIFSEAMNASTVSGSTFQLRNAASTLITATVTYNATTRTATLTPSAALASSTVYTATITGGASGVKDAAGNAMVNNYIWSFTTAAPADIIPPTVSSVLPVNGATGVSVSTAVSAIFSEAMNASTVSGTTFQLRNAASTLIAATVTYNATTRTATLTPSVALASSTVYTATITGGVSGVKDAAGNAMVNNYIWSFTTAAPADIIPPTVSSVLPVNGATGVSVSTAVSAIFSEAMNASTVSGSTIQLRNAASTLIAATVTYNATTRTVTLTPSAALANSTVYTATITGGASGVKDAAGNAMVNNYTCSFTTAAPIDIIPPTISSVSPAIGITGVSVSTTVSVVFSEAMNASTVSGSTFQLRNAANTLIAATVSYNASTNTATLTPSAVLSSATDYIATITGGASGVKDAAGNAMVNNYTWLFATADIIPPAVSLVSPANGSTGMSVNTAVSAIFSEAMNAATINSSTIQLRNAANILIAATVTYNPNAKTATLIPSAALTGLTDYTATITGGASGVKDAAGNALVNDYNWTFTTADNIPPIVSSVMPANGATGVSVGTAVSAIFNEAMNASSINNSTFELRNSANALIAATVAYNPATRTATLTPSSSLVNSSIYTAKIKGGSSGVKDLANNDFASDYTWSFTTAVTTTIFSPTDVPEIPLITDQVAEVGVKFQSIQNGYVTGIRFYKGAGNTGTHIGHLWTNTGIQLGEATFTNETLSGWQQVLFTTPIAINANTTYVASYFTSAGFYSVTNSYFTSVVNGPLRALADGEDGPNGVYIYTPAPAFPINSYLSSNYYADVLFTTTAPPDITPPTILSVAPANGTTGASVNTVVSAMFNEPLNPSSVNSSTVELRSASGTLVAAAISYNDASRTVTITPSSPCSYYKSYTAKIKGGGAGIRDVAGNPLVNDYSWTFTTAEQPLLAPTEGPGGPILVISTASNPFSRYAVEILRAEGLNEFAAADISTVTSTILNNYDVVVLGEMTVTADQVLMLTSWVNAGGTLIAFKPSPLLTPLMGLSAAAGALSDKYLLVNTASGPGVGIVNKTIQFHGSANLHTLLGATSLATLYSNATTSTVSANPAVTTKDVGIFGGKAIAFTYDLAKSIIYTRQGNPAWAGQKRDGQVDPIRSDDMFFPDWVDFNKIAIPQADEQQRLLANIILQSNLHRKPLPRFWYLPRDLKAAVIMTGDDHANGGTGSRFDQYLALGQNTAQDITDWKAVRGTSYIYPGTPMTNAQALSYQAQGFEIALHPTTNCLNYTPASLLNDFTSQLALFGTSYPGVSSPVTNRTHCIVWSDWATQPKVELQKGIRLDGTYYYWPEVWMQNRPGMFTGSGMPMRFADVDGSLIDVYQAPTQMTDETNMDYTSFCNAVLDKATGPEGYYGVFNANMHTDLAISAGSDAIIASAQAHQVPVISAKQMLTWLDGRNNSSFGNMTWSNNQLTFTVTARSSAANLKAMLPLYAETGQLISITNEGNSVPFTTQTIKGIQYAFFAVTAGVNTYIADYGAQNLRGTNPVTTKQTGQAGTTEEDKKTAQVETAEVSPSGAKLYVNVMPNPSTSYFNMIISSNDANPVTVRVMDIFGRLIETHEKITSTGILRLGHAWRGGTYFAEVIQGDKRKVVKIIKAN